MKEHDMVIIIPPVIEGKVSITVPTLGTIVHVYNNGEAFAVEIHEGKLHEVVTVPAGSLMDKGMTIEDWHTLEKLSKGLRSGDITVAQIQMLKEAL